MTEECLLKTGRIHKLTYSDPVECINVMVRVHLIKTVTCLPAFSSDTSWNATRIARPNSPTPTNSEEFILLTKQFINTTFSRGFFPVLQRKHFVLGGQNTDMLYLNTSLNTFPGQPQDLEVVRKRKD